MPTTDLQSCEAVVAALGAEGDGILHADGRTLFGPYVLPGELIRYRHGEAGRAIVERRLSDSPDRAQPPCSLFGRCGGCSLQHMRAAAAVAFKYQQVADALRGAGFALPETVTTHSSPPSTRRRMDLALRRNREGLLIGLHEPRRGEIVDMTECHVLHPRLLRLVEDMRPVLMRLASLRGSGSAIVNLLDSGPDLVLATDAPPDTADRARLADFAREAGVPRIAWRPLKPGGTPETVCAVAPVRHTLSGVAVRPPPDGFLQATREGEAAIVEAVLDAMPKAWPRRGRVVELYAGCGTLTYALARRGCVLAAEGHPASAACLRAASGGLPITVLARDLNRQPILAADLARASAVVLDPPFAGGGPQMHEVARSGVERIVMVSCNPKALRRDAEMLQEAGYALERLSVIDQFVWSTQVESVACFVRPRQPRHVKHR
ncbi:class I SAM-dependent RNA methyltransferase [Lichenicoccus sp.]|uniref:class I SAM-dependent RNA methyltransferase n=1 Tax=Lichenicoccus sp. TaxID=2781899 RepID=UPI003D126067